MNVIQFLGQATVAVNKNTNSKDIMVYLPRYSPEASGAVRANNSEVTVEGQDASGNVVRASSLRSNTVPAVWRSMGEPNRVTAPDVREGTPVLLYTIAGTDKYYWTTWGMNLVTHKLETVMWGWSANPELGTDYEFDLENYYTMLISTHTGEVRLRTTDKNSEATTWDININGKEGYLSIVGGEESILNINDVEHSLTYVNKDGSSFCIDKEDMFIKIPDSLNVEIGKQIEIYTQIMRLYIKEKLIVNCPETIWIGNITQQGEYKQKGNYSLEGGITASSSGMFGGVVMGAGLSSGGGVAVSVSINGEEVSSSSSAPDSNVSSGSAYISKNMDVKGTSNLEGTTTIESTKWKTHKHGNGNNGSPTSGVL